VRKIILAVLFITALLTQAQAQSSSASSFTPMKLAGQNLASQFAKWSATVPLGPSASGSRTVSVDESTFVVPAGSSFSPITTTNPIKIDDPANPETVTPTAVNCSFGSGICTFTATFAFAHPYNIRITSGTAGLQEAITDQQITGGWVMLTPDWTGTTSMLTVTATGSSTVGVIDQRTGVLNWYTWNGTHYVIQASISSVAGFASNQDKYLVQTAAVDLVNSQNLSALASGLMHITTGTGVVTSGVAANSDLANSSITIAGTSTALGGSITLDTITGVAANGYLKRTGANTLTNVSAIPNGDLANSSITLNGSVISLGGSKTLTLASSDFVNQGTTTTVLHGNGAGNPSFGSVVSGDLNITSTSCTNQVVTAISAGGVGTCTTVSNAMLANSTITLNAGAGSGLTTPGAMSLGSTYTIGATTDVRQFARVGLGVAADAANLLQTSGGSFINSAGALVISAPVGGHAIGTATNANQQLTLGGTFAPAGSPLGLVVQTTMTVPANTSAYGSQIIPTLNKAGAGTHAELAALLIQPVIGAGAATVTDINAVHILTMAGSGTLTNINALRVASPTGGTNQYAARFFKSDDSTPIFTATGGGSITFDQAGPHSIGGGPSTQTQLYQTGTFDPASYGFALDSTLKFVTGQNGIGVYILPTLTPHSGAGTHAVLDFVRIAGNAAATPVGVTVTDWAGLDIPSFATSGAGTNTNAYGIRVGAPTGATNNYAIRATSGSVQIDGVGPHAIGGATNSSVQFFLQGPFTPSGGGGAFEVQTTFNAAAGATGIGIYAGPTFQKAGSGTHALLAALQAVPSFLAGAAAVTDAVSVDMPTFAAPASTTNATGLRVAAPTGATNNYAIHATSGSVQLDGVGPNSVGGALDSHVQWLQQGTFAPAAGNAIAYDMTTTLDGNGGSSIYGVILQPTLVEAGAGGVHPLVTGLLVNPAITNNAATGATNVVGLYVQSFAAGAQAITASGMLLSAPSGAANNYAATLFKSDGTTVIARFYGSGRVDMPNLTTSAAQQTDSICSDGTQLILDTFAGACVASGAQYKHDIRDVQFNVGVQTDPQMPLQNDDAIATLGMEAKINAMLKLTALPKSATDLVMALKAKNFYYNISPNAPNDLGSRMQRFGFIAQDVAKIEPRLVEFLPDGTPQTVAYYEFIPILTQALQESNNRIAALEAQLKALTAKPAVTPFGVEK